MLITYSWEDMTFYAEHKGMITTTIDYDFYVEPTIKDYVDFGATSEELLGDLSDLEKDDDFYDFMKERYENKALKEWKEELL